MSSDVRTGHDGPYAAPVVVPERAVPADWIDYNGHMNVAYYTMAFDKAVDAMLETELGVGEAHVAAAGQGPYALQSMICYLGELLEGELFSIAVQLVDCDAKRLHLMLEMRKRDGTLAATCEQMLMNVDLTTRRSTPYPDWALARMQRMLADHGGLDRPAQMGQKIGIRRKG
ncbi:thioesterase family protein [Algicella marina]|uniref:Thioesterase n=1 Tax=Algicella marina TaxID=2683284 RepID=A0A6P1T0M0_9RHOB|nr:thioesterase family protein [Algicella marina]QHQ34062.1 thioesterase [Algicella marina]